MFFSKFSIKRPIAITSILIVFLLLGINSYRKLGLNNMPDIDIPYITITTIYPGASPEELEVNVAKKIEDGISTLDGLKNISSVCVENMSQIVLEFQLDVSTDVAAADVREKVDLVLNDLPKDAETPEIRKFDPNAKPIITLLLTGDLPIDHLYDYADETLSDKLSSISGVGEVEVTGGEELEVHVVLNKRKIISHDLTVADIINKLNKNNVKIPAGTITHGRQEFSVMFDSEFHDLKDISDFEIGKVRGRRVYLRDIASIKMISKKNRTKAFYDGKPAVNLKIVKKGEANTVKVVNRIKKAVMAIQNSNTLPSGMKLIWFIDDGDFIEASVMDAWYSICIGILLTAFILFAFLHELRSVFIVVLSMPASIIITFIIMKYFNYTFNNSTLLALGTSIGVLVTNSIVVIESISRRLKNMDSKLAADKGTSDVVMPVLASALTNVVVFVPIAMMSSLVGRFFIPFAVTITGATLVSLFISFSMTPMLSSIFLKKSEKKKHFILFDLYTKYWNKSYDYIENLYAEILRKLCSVSLLVITVVVLLCLGVVVFVIPKVGTSFFPDADRGEFIIKVEYPTDYNLATTTKQLLEADMKIRKLPEVLGTSVVAGKVQGVLGQVSQGVYLGEITVKTLSKNNRETDMLEMRKVLRDIFKNESDCIVTVNIPSAIGGSSSTLEMEISGNNFNELNRLITESYNIAVESGLAVDIDTNIRAGKPELRIVPNRAILQDMNIDTSFLGTIIRGNIEGIKAGLYKKGDRSYDIRVKLEEEEGIRQIDELNFASKDGKPLNINIVSSMNRNTMPIQISRAEKKRTLNLYANVAKGASLGGTVNYLNQKVKEILPAGYEMRFKGQVDKMGEAQADFLEAIIIAIVLTYLLIAAILESWTLPVLILATLPLAFMGMFVMLYVEGIPLSMMGLLGAVMLIGIVVNNAILIMDEVVILKREGYDGKEAMLTAAKHKFRPIIMTSIAAILGMLPMAFGAGLGAEMRASCGVGIVGGLLSSTFLTLFVIPLVYILFARRNKQAKKNLVQGTPLSDGLLPPS